MRFTDRICLYPGKNFLRLGCVWEETWWERTAIRLYWHLQEAVSVLFFLITPIIFRTSRSSIPIISELPSCRGWQAASGSCFLYPLLYWSAQFFFIKNKAESYMRRSPYDFWVAFFCGYCSRVCISHCKKWRILTESSKSPAEVAKSNKQGTYLYQEECKQRCHL